MLVMSRPVGCPGFWNLRLLLLNLIFQPCSSHEAVSRTFLKGKEEGNCACGENGGLAVQHTSSMDALSLRSNVISAIKIHSL